MDHLEETLGQILGDPEAMAGILSMAKNLGLGGAAAPEPPEQPEPSEPSDAPGGEQAPPPPASSLPPLRGKQAALLQALKPFLREDRREKLDRAVKAAQISRMAGVALRNLGEK